MNLNECTDEDFKKGLEYFYFLYDKHGRLFEHGIDREYVNIHCKSNTGFLTLPPALIFDFKLNHCVKQHAVEYHCITNDIKFDSKRIRDVHVAFAHAFLCNLELPPERLPTEKQYQTYKALGPSTLLEPAPFVPSQMIDIGWEPDESIVVSDKVKADYKKGYVAYLFLKSEPMSPKDDNGNQAWSSWKDYQKELEEGQLTRGNVLTPLVQNMIGSHSWIEIMCITPSGITVGPIQVPSLRTVSIGLWPPKNNTVGGILPSRVLPRGIRYNYECFTKSNALANGGIGFEGDKYIPLTCGVTMGTRLRPIDLYNINKRLFNPNWNNYELTAHTCCTFAYSIVKDLPAFKYVYATPLLSPKSLAESMQIAMKVPTVGGTNKQYDSLPLNSKFWCTTTGRQWLLEESNTDEPWPLATIWMDPVRAPKLYQCLISENPPDPWEGVVH